MMNSKSVTLDPKLHKAYLQGRKQEIESSANKQSGLSARQIEKKHRSVSSDVHFTEQGDYAPSYGKLGPAEDSGDEAVMKARKVPARSRKKPRDPAEASYGKRPGNALLEMPGFQPERVVGTDDRTRRTDTDQYPWHCICSLLITDARTNLVYMGTGWLVSPRVVITAGHCVYIYDTDNIPGDTGAWASSIEVIPGRDGTTRPFGSVETGVLRSTSGWVNDRDTRFDYGAIILPETHRYGDQLGWFGYAAWDDDTLRNNELNLSGYPADKEPTGSQWFHKQHALSVEEHELTYEIDTFGGQSGAPVWIRNAEGHRYGVAVHKAGHSTSSSVWNSAKRITRPSYDLITSWVAEVP